MLKTRSASVTESVPSALALRPVNGNASGPRWHWLFRVMRDTCGASASTSRPTALSSVQRSRLLPERARHHRLDGLALVVERHDGDHGAELFLLAARIDISHG